MNSGQGRRPSPALLVSMLALVLALTGSALALPGKNKVDKNDIQKGAVTKKAIKKGAVTKKAIKKGAVTSDRLAAGAVTGDKIAGGAVTGDKIAGGAVGANQLADSEATRLVGASGQPSFGNGGENDCIWSNVGVLFGPTGFYKDNDGVVHLSGVAASSPGPGGDGACDDTEDLIVYTLPSGYVPDEPVIAGVDDSYVLIAPDEGITTGMTTIPAGSVLAFAAQTSAAMDAITFRTAGPATASTKAEKPIRVKSLRALKRAAARLAR